MNRHFGKCPVACALHCLKRPELACTGPDRAVSDRGQAQPYGFLPAQGTCLLFILDYGGVSPH
ncbi:hypothetical protein COO20_10945 [Thalassospira marina]|uniref:Uncharacterized protein n=1 Tax=Thalassospira marina TaxID=2048283 RepID=A0A2N3KU12_9PROT|nr:hypothetical protein COO20_10945 [Thalassospira marina]